MKKTIEDKTEKNGEIIETSSGKKLKADRFMSYGDDPKYCAIVGRALYAKIDGKKYHLLKKNFLKEQ